MCRGMLREPMIAERDADLHSFQTTLCVSRVSSSNFLLQLIASSTQYHRETKTKQSTCTRGISKDLWLYRCLETSVELIAPANFYHILFLNIGTDVTSNVTGTALIIDVILLQSTNQSQKNDGGSISSKHITTLLITPLSFL